MSWWRRVWSRELPAAVCLPVVPLSCVLFWKDWARFTVPPGSPLVVASDLWPSCIRTSRRLTSGSNSRRAGLGWRGLLDVGEESGMDGGDMEGGFSFVLCWGTGLPSPSGSPLLCVAPFSSRPAKHTEPVNAESLDKTLPNIWWVRCTIVAVYPGPFPRDKILSGVLLKFKISCSCSFSL